MNTPAKAKWECKLHAQEAIKMNPSIPREISPLSPNSVSRDTGESGLHFPPDSNENTPPLPDGVRVVLVESQDFYLHLALAMTPPSPCQWCLHEEPALQPTCKSSKAPTPSVSTEASGEPGSRLYLYQIK